MVLLYADEHVPLAVIKALRRAGHDVVRAQEAFPESTPDATHFDRAIVQGRILLSQDTDFLTLSTKTLSEGTTTQVWSIGRKVPMELGRSFAVSNVTWKQRHQSHAEIW